MATLTDAQRAAGWKIVKLGDATTKIGSGSTPRGGKSAYTENGAILIRSQNVLDNKLDFMDAVHISAEAEQKLKSVKVYAGDVLLNITGSGNTTIGRSAYVKNLPEVAYVNQHVSIIRVDLKKINPIYLQKYLMAFKDSLLSLSYGSTRDALTKRIIEDFEIALPPLEEQERIAAILGSLDDKIEASIRFIQVLNNSMELLYKKYSVNGQDKILTDLAEFVNGRAFTKNATGTGRMVIRIAELNSGPGASTVYNDINGVRDENLARSGDILMSWSGSLDVYVWTRSEAIINQHIFKVIAKSGVSQWMAFYACKSAIDRFKSIAADKATTMGHIRRSDLNTVVRVPTTYISGMNELWELRVLLEETILNLSETRDLLIKSLIG